MIGRGSVPEQTWPAVCLKQANVTAEGIHELWKRDHSRVAEKGTEARGSPSPVRDPVVWIVNGCSECQELKPAGIGADPLMALKNWPWALAPNCKGDEKKKWRGEREQDRSNKEVPEPNHPIPGAAEVITDRPAKPRYRRLCELQASTHVSLSGRKSIVL